MMPAATWREETADERQRLIDVRLLSYDFLVGYNKVQAQNGTIDDPACRVQNRTERLSDGT
jgi:hypothetical protein